MVIDKLYTRDHMKIVFDKYSFTRDHIFIDKLLHMIIFLLINSIVILSSRLTYFSEQKYTNYILIYMKIN